VVVTGGPVAFYWNKIRIKMVDSRARVPMVRKFLEKLRKVTKPIFQTWKSRMKGSGIIAPLTSFQKLSMIAYLWLLHFDIKICQMEALKSTIFKNPP